MTKKLHGFVEGTSNITYLHLKGAKRHRSRCIYHGYNNSCKFNKHCIGSAQCPFYEEYNYNDELDTPPSNIYNDQDLFKKPKEERLFKGCKALELKYINVPLGKELPEQMLVDKEIKFYEKYLRFEKPVFVIFRDDEYYLECNYATYIAAKKISKNRVNCVIGTCDDALRYDSFYSVGTKVKFKSKSGVVSKVEKNKITLSFDNYKDIKRDIFDLVFDKSWVIID